MKNINYIILFVLFLSTYMSCDQNNEKFNITTFRDMKENTDIILSKYEDSLKSLRSSTEKLNEYISLLEENVSLDSIKRIIYTFNKILIHNENYIKLINKELEIFAKYQNLLKYNLYYIKNGNEITIFNNEEYFLDDLSKYDLKFNVSFNEVPFNRKFDVNNISDITFNAKFYKIIVGQKIKFKSSKLRKFNNPNPNPMVYKSHKMGLEKNMTYLFEYYANGEAIVSVHFKVI